MKYGTLLIVDDEVEILNILRERLVDCASEIIIESDSEKVVDLVMKGGIDCIVCDIKMPNVSGVDIIREIRAAKIETPFIFYTGHGNHELMLEVAKYGAFDFIDKPDMEGVEDSVTRAIKHSFKIAKDQSEPTLEENISEYQKLLQKLENT